MSIGDCCTYRVVVRVGLLGVSVELGDRVRRAKFAEGAAWGRRETRVSARAVLGGEVRVGRVGRRWLPLPLAKIPLARLWGRKCLPAEGEAGSVTV